jgi:hypothetical protein
MMGAVRLNHESRASSKLRGGVSSVKRPAISVNVIRQASVHPRPGEKEAPFLINPPLAKQQSLEEGRSSLTTYRAAFF